MIFQNTTIMPNDTDVLSDHTVINVDPPIVPPTVSPAVVPPVVEVQGGNGGNDEVLSDIENEGDTDEDSDIISVHTVYSLSSSSTISIHTIIVISD